MPGDRNENWLDVYRRHLLQPKFMQGPPEITRVSGARVACDGAHAGIPAALGHPRVFLEIDESGYVDCGYCDRRFVLVGGLADGTDLAALHDHGDGAGK